MNYPLPPAPCRFVNARPPRLRANLLAVLLLAAGFPSLAQTFDPLFPAPGAAAVEDPPALSVYLTGSPGTNYTVTFHGRRTPPVVRPDFTVVVLPDTQFYCDTNTPYSGLPEYFAMQTEWIITNRISHNIVFVTSVGDVVNQGHIESQWFHATNALYRLEDPVRTGLEHGIPYGIAPGCHDIHYPLNPGQPLYFPLYNKYFGVSRFSGKPYYGGHYGTTNDNHYELISASGVDLLFLHLEVNASAKPDVMVWANQVLQQYPDRRAIVVTHSLLRQSDWTFNEAGQPIYDGLKANTNIILMCGGHVPRTGHRSDTYLGNTIWSMKSDYENDTNGGNGWLRQMEFSPSNNVIRVKTYSPLLDTFNSTYLSAFTLNCALPLSPSFTNFTLLATLTNVPSGVAAGGPWTNLLAGTQYDWYVSASDGQTVSNSDLWSFTTSPNFPHSATSPPPALKIFKVLRQPNSDIKLRWYSLGGLRYRVEYSDADPQSGFVNPFVEIVRSVGEETDPQPPGTPSVQEFTDDFTLMGGPPVSGARYYRIRQVQ